MEKTEIIRGLEDLILDRKSFLVPGEEHDIFQRDIEVLEAAIAALEK